MARLWAPMKEWLAQVNLQMAALKENGFKATPTNAREGLAALTRKFVTQWPDIAWIRDDLVPGTAFDVPVRIYHPQPSNALPVLVYFHGGGHMAGSVTVYDPICRKIAQATQHIVVSVDYRRAPECPYPAAVNDALQVTENVWTLLDHRGLRYDRRLSIAGDSAGGALCATVAHTVQVRTDLPIDCQVLIYPSLDYTLSLKSIKTCGTGYLLEPERIRWYFDNYFQNQEDRQAASPLHMAFTGKLPDTLIITAGFCPLQDEGRAYANRLQSLGVRTRQLHLDDMIHAFLNLEDLATDACQTTYAEMGRFLNARRR